MAVKTAARERSTGGDGRSPWNASEAARWLGDLVAKGTLLPTRALLLSPDLDEEAVTLGRAGFHVIVTSPDRAALVELKKQGQARGAAIDVVAADPFSAPPSFFGPVELIVDRTFFHQLEPVRRAAWVYLAARLLPPGGHLAVLFRVGRMPGGPPYTVSLEGLRHLMRRQFTTLLLEEVGTVPAGADHAYRGLFRRL
jgi:hypothetical protein